MVVGTVWTHGHSLEVEFPERLEAVQRLSSYTRVKGNPGTVNWVHFPLPTVSNIQDTAVQLGSIFVRFRTASPDVYVDAVYVYDGEERLVEFEDLRLTPQSFETIRLDPPELRPVNWGLGISLRVVFGEEEMTHIAEFSSAGAVLTGKAVAVKDAGGRRKQGGARRARRR